MSAYDGTTVRIKSTVTDYDGNAVTNVDVATAIVNLYDPAGNYVFTNQALTWSSGKQYWYYDWQDALPGSFTAQCVFTGTDPTFEAFDYAKILVKQPKVIPTGDPTPIVG